MRNELQGIRLITDTVISGRNFHFPLCSIDTPDNVDIKQRTDKKGNLLLLATLIFGAKNIDFYQKKKKKTYGREFEDE